MKHSILLPVIIQALVVCHALSQSASRGTYYRNEKHKFELWIPEGFTEKKAQGKNLATFQGGRGGSHAINIDISAVDSIVHFVELTSKRSRNDFRDVKMDIHRNVKAGDLSAAIFVLKNLDSNAAFRGVELIEAGVFLGDGLLVRMLLYMGKGKGKEALREAQGMIATFRRSGERGLDSFLDARRLHPKTGLSFRTPLDLEEKQAAEGETLVYEGSRTQDNLRLTIEKTAHASLEAALKTAAGSGDQVVAPMDLPHSGDLVLKGGVYARKGEDRRTAVVAAQQKKGPVFLITCSGTKAAEGTLIRKAELVGMGLMAVDLAAVRTTVASARAGLANALKKKSKASIRSHVETLARNIFLPEARATLVTNLCRLQDARAVAEAVRALGGLRDAALVPVLIRAAKYTRNQGWIDALVPVLETMSQIRSPKLIPVLVKQAQRDSDQVRAAAIRTLGFYVEQKQRVLKDLLRLMKKMEALGRKASPVAKERWKLLKPAFQDALHRMTGETFDSVSDARKWLKKKPRG